MTGCLHGSPLPIHSTVITNFGQPRKRFVQEFCAARLVVRRIALAGKIHHFELQTRNPALRRVCAFFQRHDSECGSWGQRILQENSTTLAWFPVRMADNVRPHLSIALFFSAS